MRLKQFAPLIVASVMAVGLPSVSQATLIVTSVVNTPLSYTAVVEWTAGGNTLFESINLGASPWSVTLSTSQAGGFVLATAQHMVAPHVGDVAPNPNTLVGAAIFVIPGGSGSGADAVSHPIGHYDWLTLNVAPSIVTSGSTITINAMHEVPEPSTAVLAGVGGLALLVGCWRRRRAN
jgi:hypothetical protein